MRLTDIKNTNKMNVLRYLRLHEEVTKPDIAKQFGYSAPTASKLVDELVADGFAKVVGRGMSTDQGGKRPNLYAFNPMGGAVAALHIGVRGLEAALVNLGGQILYRVSEKVRPNEETGKLIQKMAASLDFVIGKAKEDGLKLLAAGIGCPGLVDFEKGTILSAYGLPKLEGAALGDEMRRRFGVPVWVDNECNNLALAEQWFGEGEMSGTMINLMIEEGIGAGIIIENEMIRGVSYSFGEVGHMVVDRNGRPCGCGNRGCWEQYVSTDALIARIADALDRSPYIASRIQSPDDITIPLIAQAVREGDAAAREIAVDEMARELAVGIASLVNIFNPNGIILHGSLTPLADALLPALVREVRARALPGPAERAAIRFSSMGRDSHLIGAATLGMKGVFDDPGALFGETAARG